MKAVIVGSGVSGLCAGSYLQMNGFETEIYEQHNSIGGLCTSWKRDGYTFESGFQWLLGSSPSSPFYQLWSELIDMDVVDFFQHDVRMEIEVKDNADRNGKKSFHLYTNLQRLEEYMLEIAPEDKKPIRNLIRSMRKIQSHEIPPAIKVNPETLPWIKKIGFARYLPLLLFMNKLKKETNFTFASKLKNPFLKEAFQLLFDGEELPLMIITVPLAFNDLRATAYPIGGAAKFVDRLKEKYLSLGGSIHFNAPVKRITTAKGVARGVELENGTSIGADIVVSTADWHFTVFTALEGKFLNRTIKKLGDLEQLPLFYSIFMVSLGVSRTFKEAPHFLRFQLEKELISPDGSHYQRMESHVYNYDPTLAPVGKTVVTVSFSTQCGAYWINLRAQDYQEYLRQKDAFAREIINRLDSKLQGIKEFIEVQDVATPATYQRYTRSRLGSVQGWMSGKDIMKRTPITSRLPGLKNFYYASHWSQPGGGLPVAIKSTRDMVQDICHDLKLPFSVPEQRKPRNR